MGCGWADQRCEVELTRLDPTREVYIIEYYGKLDHATSGGGTCMGAHIGTFVIMFICLRKALISLFLRHKIG
jgi:hypothetical protein